MICKLQDHCGIDPMISLIQGQRPFSGTEVLGVTAEQIGTPTGMLGIPEFGTNFVRAWSKRPIRRPSQSYFSSLVCLTRPDVWLGNAQDLIKAGIADLSTVIGCHPHRFTSCTRVSSLRWPLPSWSVCGKACGSRSQKKSAMAISKP